MKIDLSGKTHVIIRQRLNRVTGRSNGNNAMSIDTRAVMTGTALYSVCIVSVFT